MVEPKQVHNCSVNIFNVDFVFHSGSTDLVSRPIGNTTLDAATHKYSTQPSGVVASSTATVLGGATTEFAGNVNESILEKTTILKVIHDRSNSWIELAGIVGGTLRDASVQVPASLAHLHKTYTTLKEPSRDQHLPALCVCAVFGDCLWFFTSNVKSFTSISLHSVSQFK